jgi:hypothetical protein
MGSGVMPKSVFTTLIGLHLLLVSSALATNGDSATYFPMHVGDTWYYDFPSPPSSPWAVKTIRDSLSIDNRTYYTWTYGDGVDIIDTLRSDSVGNIWKRNGDRDYLMFDFQRDSGATYRYELGSRFGDSVYYYNVLVRTNVSTSTPAGLFQKCITLLFDIPQVRDEEVIYTFTAKIGLIKQQNDGWSVRTLTSAIINGETVVSVDRSDHIPGRFALYQNYPNPFNPNTSITYELGVASHVVLSVYDILGREVSVLVNENRTAGVHGVTFDGSNLSSGVYMYRLQAGDVVQSRRLVVLK